LKRIVAARLKPRPDTNPSCGAHTLVRVWGRRRQHRNAAELSLGRAGEGACPYAGVSLPSLLPVSAVSPPAICPFPCAIPLTLAKIKIHMKLVINGDDHQVDGPITLSGLVEHLGMKADRVAIELNLDIVPRGQWVETQLADGDRLEIVHFVGGGL